MLKWTRVEDKKSMRAFIRSTRPFNIHVGSFSLIRPTQVLKDVKKLFWGTLRAVLAQV